MATETLLKKITQNAGIIFVGNSTASALNLVSFTIIANQLGPKLLAVLVLAQTYTMIMSDIFNIQTWESVVKFGPERSGTDDMADVFKLNIGLDLISAAIACSVAVSSVGIATRLFGWESSSQTYLVAYSMTCLFNMTTLTIGAPRLFDKFLPVAKIGISIAVMRLVAVLVALQFSNDLLSYTSIFIIGDILNNLSVGLFSLILLRKKLGKGWWKRPLVFDGKQLRFIWWTNLRTILRIPVRHFDMMIISSVMSIEKVGIYKVYKEIGNIINRIGEPVNQALFPEFTKLLSTGKIKATSDITKRTMFLLSCAGIILTSALLLVAKFIVHRFFGEDYLVDINALYCLLILFGINFSILPIHSLFIAAGFARYSFFIVLLTNTIYLASAFGFGVLFGIYGVIMAYAIQMILNQSLKSYFLRKHSCEWGQVNR